MPIGSRILAGQQGLFAKLFKSRHLDAYLRTQVNLSRSRTHKSEPSVYSTQNATDSNQVGRFHQKTTGNPLLRSQLVLRLCTL
jgi:hypothetical protein